MTTAELRERIEADGVERLLERYENEPEDNAEIRALFDTAADLFWKLDEACAKLMEALGCE